MSAGSMVGTWMNKSGLDTLVGRNLSSVEFVHDYVQFRFDGPVLSAYTPPVMRTVEGTLHSSSEGSNADMLVKLIGRQVDRAESTDDHIRLEFTGGVSVVIPMHADRHSAEAATLTTGGDTIWSW
jgi:hypothetical protein